MGQQEQSACEAGERREATSSPCGEGALLPAGAYERVWSRCAKCGLACWGMSHRHVRGGEAILDGEIAFCREHGGEQRAREAVLRSRSACWFTVAPPQLTREEVVEAGNMTFELTHQFLVLREMAGGRWTFSLGSTRPAKRSYDTKLDAERAGVHAWRWAVKKRQRAVTEARGGDLSWGRPLPELEFPEVVEARVRQYVPLASGRRPHEASMRGPLPLSTNSEERRALRLAREEGKVSKQSALQSLLDRDREHGGTLPDREQLEALLRKWRENAGRDESA
jgi:hypothetical protein